jgi:hypothetical protein
MLFLAAGDAFSLDPRLLMGDPKSTPLRRKTKARKSKAVEIGFHDTDDWFDCEIEHGEKFLNRDL